MEDLGKLIGDAKEQQGLSLSDLERMTERAGHRVSRGNLSKIIRSETKVPGPQARKALSSALGIPLRDVEAAARVEELGRPFILPDYASRLSGAEREAIRNLVRVIADSKGRNNAEHEHSDNVVQGGFGQAEDAAGEDAGEEQKIPDGIAAFDRELGDGFQPGTIPED